MLSVHSTINPCKPTIDQQKLNRRPRFSIIKDITAVPEVKKIYKAKITKVVEFGAFARFLGSNEGLIHISEISNKSISSVREILHKDMYVNVKFISQDNRGKIKLSMKNIDQTSDFEY